MLKKQFILLFISVAFLVSCNNSTAPNAETSDTVQLVKNDGVQHFGEKIDEAGATLKEAKDLHKDTVTVLQAEVDQIWNKVVTGSELRKFEVSKTIS